MSDYYEVFGKIEGRLIQRNDEYVFTGKYYDLGEIVLNPGDIVDINLEDQWVPYKYYNGHFVSSEEKDNIEFSNKTEVRYHRPIDSSMKYALEQILSEDTLIFFRSKLYSFDQLTLFDCILYRHSGNNLTEGNQYFVFENEHSICSVAHSFNRVEDNNCVGGYSYTSDRFDFLPMDGESYSKTFEHKFESPAKEPEEDLDELYLEHLRKNGLID